MFQTDDDWDPPTPLEPGQRINRWEINEAVITLDLSKIYGVIKGQTLCYAAC